MDDGNVALYEQRYCEQVRTLQWQPNAECHWCSLLGDATSVECAVGVASCAKIEGKWPLPRRLNFNFVC